MSDTLRLDAALVSRGMVSGREKAKELIVGGFVQVNGQIVKKPTRTVTADDRIFCDVSSLKYVGRGGFKLEKAIEIAHLDLKDMVALDVGASTGGFTDCMLQNGAKRVFAIDVGHDQLHARLRADPRVVALEGTDIRNAEKMCKAITLYSMDFCTIDVSFISLRQVVPAVLPFLKPEASLVCLIKPQFEAGREWIGKNGVVKDFHIHSHILTTFMREFAGWGVPITHLTFSPITGGEGNVEYLAVADRRSNVRTVPALPDAVVVEARQYFRRKP